MKNPLVNQSVIAVNRQSVITEKVYRKWRSKSASGANKKEMIFDAVSEAHVDGFRHGQMEAAEWITKLVEKKYVVFLKLQPLAERQRGVKEGIGTITEWIMLKINEKYGGLK